MKALIAILLLLAATNTQAQTLNTPIPAIYWMSDTSTYTTGTFKTSTALLKKKGFVVYSKNAVGEISYTYLDATKKALDRKYYVANDDKGSAWIAFRSTLPKPFKAYLDTTRFKFLNDSTITIK